MPRIRKVFDTSQIAGMWRQQEVDYARNKQDNFWFRGQSLYSYGTEIARLIEIPRKKWDLIPQEFVRPHALALISEETYSATTRKHIDDAHRACGMFSSVQSISVGGASWGGHILRFPSRFDFINPLDRKSIVRFLQDRQQNCLEKAMRARENKPLYLRRAGVYRSELRLFEFCFPIPGKNKSRFEPENNTQGSTEEVRQLMECLMKPVTKQEWITGEEARKITRRLPFHVVTAAIESRSHIVYRKGRPCVSAPFYALFKKYPKELLTLLNLQTEMAR